MWSLPSADSSSASPSPVRRAAVPPLVPPLAYLHTLVNGGRHAEWQPPTCWLPPGIRPSVPGPPVPSPEPGSEPGRWPCRAGPPPLLGGRSRQRRWEEGIGAAGADAAGVARRRGACRVGRLRPRPQDHPG